MIFELGKVRLGRKAVDQRQTDQNIDKGINAYYSLTISNDTNSHLNDI